MVGRATTDRGGSQKPPIEWALGLRLNNRRTRKTQRDGHNSGVKIWSLCSVSSICSHATLEKPFRTLANKVRGKYVVKEVFLRLPSCILIVTARVLYSYVCRLSCVCYHCVGMYPVYICIFCMDQQMSIQHIPIWCLFQQSSSRIQNEPGYRKRQFLSITTRHQREGLRKMLELKEVEKKNRQR